MATRAIASGPSTPANAPQSRCASKSCCATSTASRLYNARAMPRKAVISWLEEPEDHNYPAAESYLRLAFDARASWSYVRQLRAAPILQFKAKDIFRASGLSLLGVSN